MDDTTSSAFVVSSESNVKNTEEEHFAGQNIHLVDDSISQSSENAEVQSKRSYNKTKEGKQKRKKAWSALTPDEIALFPENTTLEEIHENTYYLKILCDHRNKLCKRRKTEEKKMKLLEEKHQFEQENKCLEVALEASRKHASKIEKNFYLQSSKGLISDSEQSNTESCELSASISSSKKSVNRATVSVPESSWHNKFSPLFYPSTTSMAEQDFKLLKFQPNGAPDWKSFALLNSLAEQDLVPFQITFDGLTKIKKVFKSNVLYKMWSKGRKLESKRSHRWGYSLHPKESGSKRTYAMSETSFTNLKDSHFELLTGAFSFLKTKVTTYGVWRRDL